MKRIVLDELLKTLGKQTGWSDNAIWIELTTLAEDAVAERMSEMKKEIAELRRVVSKLQKKQAKVVA